MNIVKYVFGIFTYNSYFLQKKMERQDTKMMKKFSTFSNILFPMRAENENPCSEEGDE